MPAAHRTPPAATPTGEPDLVTAHVRTRHPHDYVLHNEQDGTRWRLDAAGHWHADHTPTRGTLQIAALSAHWRLFAAHRPVGAYLPVGQLDGDCSCGNGTWPCPALTPALTAFAALAVPEDRATTPSSDAADTAGADLRDLAITLARISTDPNIREAHPGDRAAVKRASQILSALAPDRP